MNEYFILSDTKKMALVEKVNLMFPAWKPLGGISVGPHGFYQAMIKEDE